MAVLLGTLSIGQASLAQEEVVTTETAPHGPVTQEFAGSFLDRGSDALFRMHYHTEGYGENYGKVSTGMQVFFPSQSGVGFFDGQLNLGDKRASFDVGGGVRFLHEGFQGGTPRLFGFNVYFDGEETDLGGFFPQIGFGVESLGEVWDFRANANIPLGDRTHYGPSTFLGETLRYTGNTLGMETLTAYDTSVSVVDLEAARRLGDRNAWLFVGPYFLDGGGEQVGGVKGGVRGFVTDNLAMHVTATRDDMFKSEVAFGLTWFIGRGARDPMIPRNLVDRMRDPVERNNYVALKREAESSFDTLVDLEGNEIFLVHVDSNAGGANLGTFEDPLTSLDAVAANSAENNIILVHAESEFDGQSVVLQDGQRLLGEGGDVVHTIAVAEIGEIDLPETSTGSLAGTLPIIRNAPGAAVQLVANNEVAGFTIDGGGQGLYALDATGSMTIDRVAIGGTTGQGIHIEGGDASYAFTDMAITNPLGTGLSIVGGSSNVGFSGLITQANNAAAVAISGEHSGTVSLVEANEDEGIIAATNGTGLQFDNADGIYSFNHAVTLDGGDAGIDILNDSEGSFAFSNVTITNPTGTAFNLDGGSSNVAFTGSILQENAAAAVAISGDHTGSVTFNEREEDAGIITATNGNGLQFNSADGVYTFNHAVVLDGADAGIDILNESDGSFTFDNLTITDPSGIGLNIEGGAASVTISGKITQTNNVAAVSVSGGHTGAVLFSEAVADEGIINATNGTGLQFDNADGDYHFNDAVTLAGGDAGIDILGASDGSFIFSNATITNPTGVAFNIEGGNANVGFAGLITQSNDVTALSISGEHTGTLTFSEATDDAGVFAVSNGNGFQFNNADGSYRFNSAVTLAGGDAGIDILNDSDGSFTFTRTTITNPTGIAFNLNGGSATVTYFGKITQSNDVTAVAISGGHDGVVNFSEMTTDEGVIEATDGDGLQFDNADGTYRFNDAVVLNGGNAGIDILNGSDGSFTFSNATITDPTGTAFNVEGGEADATFIGKITQSNAADAVSISGGHSGTIQFAEFTDDDGVIDATNGDGLQFDNADGTYRFIDAVVLNGGNAGVDILNGSDGSFTFSNTTITSPTGIGFTLDGGEASISFTGKITQANDAAAVAVSGGHTGTFTLDEATADAGVVEATNGVGLQFDNADGVYRFNDAVTLNGGDAGIDIVNGSDGSFTFSEGTITNPTGTAFNVDGGDNTITSALEITNNAGNSVVIDSRTGGTLTLSGPITDTGAGLLVQNNTGGTIAFTGALDLDTGDDNAITLANNTGATIQFSQLDINTTGGDGFAASGGGTVTVSGTSNTITTTTGTGLSLANVTIGSGGVRFNDVSVDGATNGILINNVTGGAVSVGMGGSLAGDGGTIANTTGDGISITNAANVSINYMDINNAGGDGVHLAHTDSNAFLVTLNGNRIYSSGGQGVELAASGSGSMRLNLTGNSISESAAESILLSVSGNAQLANITVSDNYVTNTAGQEAFQLDTSGAALKTVNLLLEDNAFANSSATAATVSVTADGSSLLRATVLGNTMTNGGSGREYSVTTANNAASLRLKMQYNTVNAGAGEFHLTNTAGSFSVEKYTVPVASDLDVFELNYGTFVTSGSIATDPGSIPTP